MSANEIDLAMADWRSTFYGQGAPYKLQKLRENLSDFCDFWKPEDSLLDVGCNVGAIYDHLRRPERYLGIDLSEKHIADARVAYPEAKFQVLDLFNLNERADVVLCSRVLMHVAPFAVALRILRRAANKLCVLFVPIGEEDRLSIEEGDNGISYFRTFSEKTLRAQGDCEIRRHKRYSTVVYAS